MAFWDTWSKNQKIAAVGAGGLAGLYLMSRGAGGIGGGDAEDGNLNILDVRRPTDDINAVGGRDPNAWLLREIFRDLRKDQGNPVITPPVTPGDPGNPANNRISQPVRVARGTYRAGGVTYHSGKGADDNFIVNRRGQVLVRGVIGDRAWFRLKQRLNLGYIPKKYRDLTNPKIRAEIRPASPEPPPNGGIVPQRKQGRMRGTGAGV